MKKEVKRQPETVTKSIKFYQQSSWLFKWGFVSLEQEKLCSSNRTNSSGQTIRIGF